MCGRFQSPDYLARSTAIKQRSTCGKYFLDSIKSTRGCPVRVCTDPGTENELVAVINCYLRAEELDECRDSLAQKYVTSTSNQTTECQWAHFQQQCSSW